MRQRKTLVVCAAAATAVVTSAVSWRATVKAAAAAQGSGSPVRTAPSGQRFGANPGQRGATYYGFEGQAVRVTTRFSDATVVAEREFDGDLQARVSDRDGNEVARFRVDRIESSSAMLHYRPADQLPLLAYAEPGAHTTLDWANQQAYSLWKDGVGASSTLEWQGGLMRPRGAAKRDNARAIVGLDTEWSNGLTARASRASVRRHEAVKGRIVDGALLVTRLARNGVEVGTLNWFEESRLFLWDLPGLTKGYLAPEHLKDFGGWPFAPDMAWMNIQATAFHHFKTLLQKQGFVAGRQQPSWPARLATLIEPTLHANEPGCDDLHWLDGTVLRFCCDIHDLCYEKFGCDGRSWWRFWTNWSCEYCNGWVVVCFISGATTEWSDRGMVK